MDIMTTRLKRPNPSLEFASLEEAILFSDCHGIGK